MWIEKYLDPYGLSTFIENKGVAISTRQHRFAHDPDQHQNICNQLWKNNVK